MKQSVVQEAPIRIVVESVPPLLVISLHGWLDSGCAELIRAIDLGDLSRISTIVVDLSRLNFCDSTGMHALLNLRTKYEVPGREVRIVNACPLVRRLCVLMGEQQSLSA